MKNTNKHIVESRNLYIRGLDVNDIDNGWLRWVNSANTTRYLSDRRPKSRQDLIHYLDSSTPPNVYMFALCEKVSNKYIGNIRLSSINWIDRRAIYGRMIGVEESRGKGYGTEALIILAYYAFYILGLNRIETAVVNTNIASIKSNEKAGAKQEGIGRQRVMLGGNYVDDVRFGLLRKDFDKTSWQDIILD